MAIRPSQTALRELQENKKKKTAELAQAYQAMGGNNPAYKPTANNPVPRASIPALERDFVNAFEQAESQSGIGNIKNNLKPTSAMSALGLLSDIRGEYGDAIQANAQLYNDLKNKQTQEAINEVEQPEITTVPTIMGMGNGAFGLPAAGSSASREDLQRLYRQQNQEKNEKNQREFANNHEVLATLASAFSRPIETTEGVLQNLGEYITGKPLSQTYTPGTNMRDTVTGKIESTPGRIAYSAGNSIADMLIAAALGGGQAGNVIMGAEKASDVMNGANARGLTPDQILAEGALSGVSTALTEMTPFRKITGSRGGYWEAIKKEASQEFWEDVLDTAFDEGVTSFGGNYDKSEKRSEYLNYLKEGDTPQEAFWKTLKNFGIQLGTDALVGGITGGATQGAVDIYNGVNPFGGGPNKPGGGAKPPANNEDTSGGKIIPFPNQNEQQGAAMSPTAETQNGLIPALNDFLANNMGAVSTQIPEVQQTAQPIENTIPTAENQTVQPVENRIPTVENQTAQPDFTPEDELRIRREADHNLAHQLFEETNGQLNNNDLEALRYLVEDELKRKVTEYEFEGLVNNVKKYGEAGYRYWVDSYMENQTGIKTPEWEDYYKQWNENNATPEDEMRVRREASRRNVHQLFEETDGKLNKNDLEALRFAVEDELKRNLTEYEFQGLVNNVNNYGEEGYLYWMNQQPEVQQATQLLTRTEARQYRNLAEQYKDKLATFNNHAYDAQLDAAANAVINNEPNAVEDFNNLIASIDENMNGETVGESERAANKDFYDQMKAATDGRVIHIDNNTLEEMGLTLKELIDKVSTGVGKLRFVKNGGTPIDAAYSEIYDAAGGMLPDPSSMAPGDLYNALVNYMSEFKSDKNGVVNESSWSDIPLSETRTEAIAELETLSDELLDNYEAGNYKNSDEVTDAFENFINRATELSKKYPKIADDIFNIVSDTSSAYRDINSRVNLDEDIKNAQTVEEVADLANKEIDGLNMNLQFFGENGKANSYDSRMSKSDINGVHTGRFKESQVYNNTGKNGDIMTERQIEEHEKLNNMLYEENSEKESMDQAYKNLKENGTSAERTRLLGKDGWTNSDVDEAFILWQTNVEEAKARDAAGLDSTEAWENAAKWFEKIKNEGSRKGQSLQAFAKWSRNCTPEGLLNEAATILNEYQEGLDRYKKYSWTKEVRRETKPANRLDADFMKRFLQEADNLYSGDFNSVKQLTDNYTIKITPKMIKDLGFKSLADLNSAVYTDTDNSIKFTTNTKAENAKSLTDAYTEMYNKSSDKFSDPRNMDEMNMLNDIVQYVSTRGRMINLNSRSAKHTMANLGRMVNEQMPSNIAERVTTFLMDNMLGNVRTLITRNAGGNIGFNLMEQFLRKPLSAAIDSGLSKKRGTVRNISGLTREGWNAWKEGFRDGLAQEIYDFKNDIQSARSGENNLRTAVSNNRNNVFDLYRLNKDTQQNERTYKSKLLQKYNKLVKAGLSIGDRPFYEATYKQSMAEYNRMYKEGKFGDLSREDFDTLAEAHAKLNALAAVYQDDSVLSKAFVGLKKDIGLLSEGTIGTDILSQFSMPFVKTPANIIARSIEYSPLGLVKNAIQTIREISSDRIDFNQERFATETSRNIIGTALFAIGLGLAQAGGLTGAYSDDKDMKQAQKEAGMQQFALHTGMGDFDLSWIPVLGNNLVSAAAAYDSANRADTEGIQALSNGATAGVKSQFDTSMLQGLQRLVGGSGSYNSEGDIVTNAKDTLLSGVTQFVPSLLRQAAAFTDENQRQLSGANKDDYYYNQFLNSIPGLRQTLQPKIGRTGEELEQNVGQGTLGKFLSNFISPSTWTQGTEDPVRDEAMRLYQATGNNIAFEPTVSIGDLKTEDHVPTPEEFTAYQREAYGDMNRIAQEMIESDFYDGLSDGDKESVLAEIYSAVKSVAKANALDKDTDSLSGAAKAYAQGGDDALIEYVTARNALAAMGLSNSESNRDRVIETLQSGGAEAVQNMVTQSQELEAAGLNANMQFKYDHASQYIPSLSPTQFADTWNAVNTDNNSSIKIDEVLAYLNKNPNQYNEQTAQQFWNAYYTGSSNKIPVLNSNGVWVAQNP